MTDLIVVRDLAVDTRIGVTDDERARPQTIVIQLEIEIDLARAGASDELVDTLDYSRAVAEVADLLGAGEYHLLEHAAEAVAGSIVANKGVRGVTVEIAKKPPIPQEVGSVAVRITRTP